MNRTMTSLLESCRISPPPGAVAEQSLPLTFFDITWLHFRPIRRLLFYDFPCSKPHFLSTLLPNLKHSLSLTLQHFFPLAGRILYPLNPAGKPVLRYRPGDSVSVTISESSHHFHNLVANHPRDADNFHDFIPQIPPVMENSDQKVLEVLAVQVTLFPDHGVCVGLSNHHSVGDATSIAGFLNSWASINKIGGKLEELPVQFSPVFDRSLINYPRILDSIYWDQTLNSPTAPISFTVPTNRVRATFVFTESELKRLKNLVRTRIPGLVHVSSFVVTAAYVWTCVAKSVGEDEVVEDDEPEFFLFVVDSRARIDPPVPGNYFGNCLSHGLPKLRHQELVEDGGFFAAAEAIAEEIRNRVIDNENILEGAENWKHEIGSAVQRRILAVSGSTRVDLYGADFGWGRARKMETLTIDGDEYAMSLCKSRDCEGGLEVGMSLPKDKMDAFSAHFYGGIEQFRFSGANATTS